MVLRSPFPASSLADRHPARRSADERLIGMVQDARPEVTAVLDLLGCTPFTRLTQVLSLDEALTGDALPAELPRRNGGSDQDLGADGELRVSAHGEGAEDDRDERPVPWDEPWNRSMPISHYLHQNVWGWAVTADRPVEAMARLRPWVDASLQRHGDHARTVAVAALFDDRWSLYATLRMNDPERLRAAWSEVVGALARAPGPWPAFPDGPEPLLPTGTPLAGTDHQAWATAWVARAFLHHTMAEGQHAAWAVPVITGLMEGPSVWTACPLPVPAWDEPGLQAIRPTPSPRAPAVARAYAEFSFRLADAMVLNGGAAMPAIPWGLHGGPAATLLGIAWGALNTALDQQVRQPMAWFNTVDGIDGLIALINGPTPLHVAVLHHAPSGADASPDLPDPRHDPFHPAVEGRGGPGGPVLGPQTVEQSMGEWFAALPEGRFWDSPLGAEVRRLRQALEARQLRDAVGEPARESRAPSTDGPLLVRESRRL